MTTSNKSLMLAFAALLACGALSAVRAERSLQEAFAKSAPSETVPFGWVATHPDHVGVRKLANTPYLRIWYTSAGGGSSAVYFVATHEGIAEGGKLANFRGDVILRTGGARPPADTTLRGVVIRAQTTDLSAPAARPFWGYSIGVIATGDRRGLYLFENPTGTNSKGFGTELAQAPLGEELILNTDYTLRFEANGPHLRASLDDQNGKTLATISYDQAAEVTGVFGLRAAHSNMNQNTYFRNLTVTPLNP